MKEDEALEMMMSASSSSISVMKVFLAGNFIINVFLSMSMNLLWSLLNTLQIIVALPLVNINFPYNAFFLSQALNKIANFAMIPMEGFNKVLFDFDSDSKVKIFRLGDYSFESSNFILNSELLGWILNGYIILTLFVVIFKPFLGSFRFFKWIESKLFWTMIIRFLLEGYFELYLCVIVNINQLMWTTSGEVIASIYTLFFLAIFSTMPLALYYFLNAKSRLLSNPNF